MRRSGLLATLVAVSLPLFAGVAHAGGWAVTTLSSTPRDGTPGMTWVVDVEVLQHGREPVELLDPAVAIASASGATRTFPARPTGRPGVYRARVVYPDAGNWKTVVRTGFGEDLAVPPITVREPAPISATASAGDRAGGPLWHYGAALVAGLAAALVTRSARRRDRSPARGSRPAAA